MMVCMPQVSAPAVGCRCCFMQLHLQLLLPQPPAYMDGCPVVAVLMICNRAAGSRQGSSRTKQVREQ